jgi:hypothetical protein
MFDGRHIGRFSAFEAPAASFSPLPEGQALFRDDAGATWDMLGRLAGGPGAGRLAPVTHYTSYWFSASGAYPELELSP